MEIKHGETHTYTMGCRCIPCVDYYRVCQIMFKRHKRTGVWFIIHSGKSEIMYPDAFVKWINQHEKR